jgi:transcription elongation factor Elf1
MRCSGCEKFGSNGEPEAEAESYDVSDTSISAEIKVDVPCGNCGGEFKTGYLSLEAEIDTDTHDEECEIVVEGKNPDGSDESLVVTLESDPDRFRELADTERTFTITDVNVEVSDDYRPKFKTVRDRKTKELVQKPIPFRYQRHYYDVTVTFSVRCESCGGDFEVTAEDSLGAGELEAA